MNEKKFGSKGHYDWINPLEAKGELRKYFPAKGRCYTINNFRHIIIGLGGFPKNKEDIFSVREAYQYDPKNNTIRVRFWDISLLTLPNQAAEDIYWDSMEEQRGIDSLLHNPEYIEWKRRVANRRTERGAYGHGKFGDEIERELNRDALHVLNPMRVVRYVRTEFLRIHAFTGIFKRSSPSRVKNSYAVEHDPIDEPSKRDLAAVAGRDDEEAPNVESLVKQFEESQS
ncbi:hypothetical protein J4447_00170 [Candidatus Pacearchaeota archaeon]|nr:hypothetical protein [Candidatus Pacearchaeota archaeon]